MAATRQMTSLCPLWKRSGVASCGEWKMVVMSYNVAWLPALLPTIWRMWQVCAVAVWRLLLRTILHISNVWAK